MRIASRNNIIGFLFLFVACGGGGSDTNNEVINSTTTTTTTPPTTTNSQVCSESGGMIPSVSQQLAWQHYASDQFSSRYIPTNKLTNDNFSSLSVAWRWCSPVNNLSESFSVGENKVTPIMIDGVLYATTQLNQVVAINAIDGESIWTFDPKSYEAGDPPNHGFIHRGLSYFSNGEQKRILVGTLDSFLYSLDAETGEVDINFSGGRIDLREGLGRPINNNYYGVNSPPMVCKDTVVVGSTVLDWPAENYMPPGDVRGFDIVTGQLKWQFHSIPHEGEFGSETWENQSYLEGAGTNVWSWFSCDENLNLVYLPLTTPTNDHYGGGRLGDNLFAESIVALDIETGSRKWHFQTVHHGLWDYDLPAAPNLIDIRESNITTPLLAQVTKQGFVFVLNRESGVPFWPIVETPVPQTTLTGEKTSPTQPIPSKPLPFEHQGVNENNLIDFTESLRSQALDIVSEFDYGELYLPPTNKGAVAVPGIGGGASWSGAAFHPDKQILYVPSVTWPFVTRIERSGLQTIQNRDFINGPSGLPLMKPPYGRVTAINMKTGDHLWQSGVGVGFENNANIASMNLSGLGYPQRIFVAATKNLLLTAQQTLSAFDLESGSKIAEVALPSSALGSLMVYELNNKLYIVIPVGGDGIKSELIAYSLD